MKENWKELIGKRILLNRKYVSGITEMTVLEVSKSGKYVKFKRESGACGWEEPEDAPNFSYTEILEILDDDKEMPVILKNGETLITTITIQFGETSVDVYLDDFYVTLDGDIVFDPFCAIPFDDREILKF